MRKYQQLLLLLVSCCSIAVLIMYRSENNRLKYVLKVVNFFGRSDAATMRLNETTDNNNALLLDFAHPLPVWQAVDENFHSYAAYWNRNELVAGGEAIALITGKRGAVVNFRCTLLYDYGARSVQGKFRFQRLDKEFEDEGSDFTSYSFSCLLTRDFGQPESVVFSAVATATAATHKLRLRYVRETSTTSSPTQLTVCLNLVTGGGNQSGASFARDERHMLQFFLHHHALGVSHFIVYNSDELLPHLPQQLHAHGIQLHRLPFNFPFAQTNSSVERLRRIVEADCLMRNTNAARHTLLLAANEFFYPNVQPREAAASLSTSLGHYAAAINRFELPAFVVCLNTGKLLIESTMYDPEARVPHRVFVYRPYVPLTSTTVVTTSPVTLPLSHSLMHRYVDCVRPGKDGLHDWRGSLREDFLRNLLSLRSDIAALLGLRISLP